MMTYMSFQRNLAHPFLSFVFVVVAASVLLCYFPSTSMGAATYKIGGRTGWDGESTDFVDYETWSLSKNFYVSDTIWFEYNAGSDNVFEVRAKDFVLCNRPSIPVAVYTSGNDSITFGEEGCYYYISGHHPHCRQGRKVAFFVHRIGVQLRGPASPLSCYPSSNSLRSRERQDDSVHELLAIIVFVTFVGTPVLLFLVFIIVCIKGCIIKPDSVPILPTQGKWGQPLISDLSHPD